MNLLGTRFRFQLLAPFFFQSAQRSFVSSYFTSMAPYVTHRENGVITVSPKVESDQSGLVVICHGLGDSAEGFVDVAEVREETYV
jgi:alpha-beta hydrolase superfamily lysophospholipase